MKELKGAARIALTGTPVENRLSDLWSLFDFLNPGLLGGAKAFGAFVKKLGKQRAQPLRPAADAGPALHPPPAQDRQARHRRPAGQDRGQRLLQPQQAAGGAVRAVVSASWPRSSKEADGIQRRGIVLAYLMRLKQICNHPSQVTGDGDLRPDAERQVPAAGANSARSLPSGRKRP